MKYIQLGLHLTDDDLGLKKVTIDHNDTDLESNSKLLELVAFAIIKSLRLNKESLMVQDLLSELGIDMPKS